MKMLKTETFEIPQLSEYLPTENKENKDNKDNKDNIKSERKIRRSSLPKLDSNNKEVEKEKILFPGFDKNSFDKVSTLTPLTKIISPFGSIVNFFFSYCFCN